jgi:hypothetical protein
MVNIKVTGYNKLNGYYVSTDSANVQAAAMLIVEQLESGPSGGIKQGFPLALASNAIADGDTFIITDGTTTETWTFKTVVATTFQVLIGADKTATTTNLIASINAHSTLWRAKVTTTISSYFSPTLTPAITIYRRTVIDADDRVYGVIVGGQGAIRVLQLTTTDYSKTGIIETDLSAVDPELRYAGYSRVLSSLVNCEPHTTVESCISYYWHEDNQLWSPGNGVTSRGWKESLLTPNQLINGISGGIAAAMLFRFRIVPTAGDTIVITNGVDTETYVAAALAAAPFEYTIGIDADTTAVNFVATVTADSTFFNPVISIELDPYFTVTGGTKVALVRKTTALTADRIYGTFTTSTLDVIKFGPHSIDYSPHGVGNLILPAADPGSSGQMCGIARPQASIKTCDTFKVATDSSILSWKQGSKTWLQVIDFSQKDIVNGVAGLDTDAVLIKESRSVKSGVLVKEQLLDGGSGGVCPATAVLLSGAPLVFGDSFVIENGTVTETFTGIEGNPTVAFEFNVGPNATNAMHGLAAAINIDSTLYSAVVYTTLGYHFASSPSTVLVIYTKLAGIATFRVFGTLSAATANVRRFTNTYDYTIKSGTEATLPNSDPTTPDCGYGRLLVALISGGTHTAQATNTKHTWRAQTNIWELISGPSISKWSRYNLTFFDFSAAATTTHIELFKLQPREVIEAVIIQHSVAFSGGLISAYTFSVGITSSLDKYGTIFDVFQAVGPTVFGSDVYSFLGLENMAAETSIRVSATTTGADLDAALGGNVTFWIKTSRGPQV